MSQIIETIIRCIVGRRTLSARNQSIDSTGPRNSTSPSIESTASTPRIKVPSGRQSNDVLALQFPGLVTTRDRSDYVMTSEEIDRRSWGEEMLKRSRERYERTIKTDLEREIRDTLIKRDVW